MSVTYLPVVDEVGVERLGCAYRGGAVAPRRVKQHRASVSRADDQRIRTAVLEVPRPRVRTVRAELRSASRRCVAARLLAVIVHHDDTRLLTPYRITLLATAHYKQRVSL